MKEIETGKLTDANIQKFLRKASSIKDIEINERFHNQKQFNIYCGDDDNDDVNGNNNNNNNNNNI